MERRRRRFRHPFVGVLRESRSIRPPILRLSRASPAFARASAVYADLMFIRTSRPSGFGLAIGWLGALAVAVACVWAFIGVYTQVGGDWAADVETSAPRMPLPLFVWAAGCALVFLASMAGVLAPIWVPLWSSVRARRQEQNTLSDRMKKWHR
ncbi:hypothetical protein GCM10017607_32470 [Microbacterium thalassium]|nr:hypothetical protein GCM10017607_32470 [Microbacterium thalassium]